MQMKTETDTVAIQKHEKIVSVDFVRAIGVIGIIMFHISCHTDGHAAKFLLSTPNGNWGGIFVNIFFLVSGLVLYHNHSESVELKKFYFKRWKSIFPLFYIVWFYRYIKTAVVYGKLFYSGPPIYLILTLLGMDGYLAHRFPQSYYLVGEWFLGAIILLYILYPLLLKVVNTLGYGVLFVIILGCIWIERTDFFTITISYNLIYCASVFCLGMLISKYQLYKIGKLKILSVLTFVFMLFFPLPLSHNYTRIIMCISGFFSLYQLGEYFMKAGLINKIVTLISKLSFPIYLVHHFIIIELVAQFNPIATVEISCIFLAVMVVSVIYACFFNNISLFLMNQPVFRKIEKFFITE